jgi:hypothetical protein
MKNELTINGLSGNELTIFEGKALDPKAPEKIKISGNISAVKEFLTKRTAANGIVLQKVDKNYAIMTVSEDEMYIRLELDPENIYGTEVFGRLEFSKEVAQFSINQAKTFSREELIKLLRFSKILFTDADKHDALLKAYQTFNFTAHIQAAEASDTRGNKTKGFEKTLQTNLPTEFILGLPIFKGQGKEIFRVEICMDSTDASIRFWFESVELHDLIEQRKIEIFMDQLSAFQDFVIIRK